MPLCKYDGDVKPSRNISTKFKYTETSVATFEKHAPGGVRFGHA